ncbi:hypothetical protein B566_EDAN006616 [Ephemera danica]|nr:hypothetical protein B566_EDAN006616 [Ephemera danica]
MNVLLFNSVLLTSITAQPLQTLLDPELMAHGMLSETRNKRSVIALGIGAAAAGIAAVGGTVYGIKKLHNYRKRKEEQKIRENLIRQQYQLAHFASRPGSL